MDEESYSFKLEATIGWGVIILQIRIDYCNTRDTIRVGITGHNVGWAPHSSAINGTPHSHKHTSRRWSGVFQYTFFSRRESLTDTALERSLLDTAGASCSSVMLRGSHRVARVRDISSLGFPSSIHTRTSQLDATRSHPAWKSDGISLTYFNLCLLSLYLLSI